MRRLLIITIFLSLMLLGQGGAESQPPAPSPSKNSQSQKQKEDSKQAEAPKLQRDSKGLPIFIVTLESPVDRNEKIEERQYREQETSIGNRNNVITAGLFIVALFQIGLFYRQLNLMNETLKDTKKAADAAFEAAEASKLATRAYIRISACPPGIDLREYAVPHPHAQVLSNLKIHNYGETPAHITDIVIKTCIEETYTPLPKSPDYSTDAKLPFSHAFLVRGESIFYKFRDESLLSETDIASIRSKKNTLYLYGYVAYIDSFGNRHRGGFGYRYYPPYDDSKNYGDDTVPYKERNNLVFLMQDGYNYDIAQKDKTDTA